MSLDGADETTTVWRAKEGQERGSDEWVALQSSLHLGNGCRCALGGARSVYGGVDVVVQRDLRSRQPLLPWLVAASARRVKLNKALLRGFRARRGNWATVMIEIVRAAIQNT